MNPRSLFEPAAPAAAAQVVRLASLDDAGAFRDAARRLLLQQVPPEGVQWLEPQAADLFIPAAGSAADAAEAMRLDAANGPALKLPAAFVELCQHAALHADPGRHALLYRLAWRLLHEPGLRADPLDADWMQVQRMARAVRRDMHKMTAFVRFRPLPAPTDDDWRITHVAWFEPVHHTLRATAPFFARRFAQMPWAILTPEASARWDGRRLAFGPGARRDEAPGPDAAEQLWLTYYESIFNPARLKLTMMRKEMPRRYWKNLPEAALIQPLAARAAERGARMVAQGGTEPVRRRPLASLALRIEPPPPVTDAAAAPATLAELGQALSRCRACPIGQHATQAVAGEGAPGARLMLVGEQPGDQEDLQGRPFVGPAGQLLDRALAQLGWPRQALYLTNAVKHFKFEPRGKRRMHKTAGQREAAACGPWLEHEIALVRPAALVALGATAARALLGRPVAVTEARGQWLPRFDGLPVLVTLHPAALLRGDAELEDAFAAWAADLARATEHLAA
ncbi:UdgX family uracil-DNA binding protein [Aquincola sp. MAHUQ-54]|uniref:Type-4 uracil-DNA glycosylase n=1 Tax=Aquincola agrisoli TaxID=3119538 RepID=A0AAW9QIA9_9BURK